MKLTAVFALAIVPLLALAAPTAIPAEAAAAEADATNMKHHCKPLIWHHHEGAKCHREEAEAKKHDHDAEDGWSKRSVDVIAASAPTTSAVEVTPANLGVLQTPSPMWLEPDLKEGPQVIAVVEIVRMSQALAEAMKDPADVEQVNVLTNKLIAGSFRDSPNEQITTGP